MYDGSSLKDELTRVGVKAFLAEGDAAAKLLDAADAAKKPGRFDAINYVVPAITESEAD